MWLNDDIRFCFTVFEDNEQYEAGDTYLHTFWKPNWPFCTTKWCYFFASIAGVYCVSTSPYFEYHNDGIDPVVPPRVLDLYTSVEPQRLNLTSSNVWQVQDLSKLVDENASAAIIQVINRYATTDVQCGVRKNGDTVTISSLMHQSSQVWAVGGLDSDKKLELYSSRHSTMDFFLMGYTNSRFVMLDEGINLWDGIEDAWRSYDIGSLYPTAVAAILDMGKVGGGEPWWGVRCGGSTDNRTQSSERSWCIVPLHTDGTFEFRVNSWPAANPRLQLIGYVTGTIVYHQNAQAIAVAVGGAYSQVQLKSGPVSPCLVVVVCVCANPAIPAGIQKGYSRIEAKPYFQRKSWAFIHPAPNGTGNFYRGNIAQTFWRSIEFETDL